MSELLPASIVTGGGRGIGRAIALRLARETAVIVVGRTGSDLESVCGEIREGGGLAAACVGDTAVAATAERAVGTAREAGWTIRHLICNAGIGKGGPTATFDKQMWRDIMEINLGGSFHFVQACLPAMLESQQGTICLISIFGTFSLVSRVATFYPLVGVWKSEVMDLCRVAGVPAEIIESSRKADVPCGRTVQMADIGIGKIDRFLRVKTGELPADDPTDLTEAERQYLEKTYRTGQPKRGLPKRAPRI